MFDVVGVDLGVGLDLDLGLDLGLDFRIGFNDFSGFCTAKGINVVPARVLRVWDRVVMPWVLWVFMVGFKTTCRVILIARFPTTKTRHVFRAAVLAQLGSV